MTLERLTGLLRRAGIDPATGRVVSASAIGLARIIAEDKATRWPLCPLARTESAILDAIPVQDGIREAI